MFPPTKKKKKMSDSHKKWLTCDVCGHTLHFSLCVSACLFMVCTWRSKEGQRTTLGTCMSSSFTSFAAGLLLFTAVCRVLDGALCSRRVPCLHLPFPSRSAGMAVVYTGCPAFFCGFWNLNSDLHACIGSTFTHISPSHLVCKAKASWVMCLGNWHWPLHSL